MTHFLKLCYNVFILENKIDARVVRRTCVSICVIYLVGNCVNLCQFGEGFLLVDGIKKKTCWKESHCG
jgi:hypothetical protein